MGAQTARDRVVAYREAAVEARVNTDPNNTPGESPGQGGAEGVSANAGREGEIWGATGGGTLALKMRI